MKKRNIIFVSVLVIFVIAVAILVSSKVFLNYEMKSALAEKYSWKTSDIKIREHEPERTKRNLDLEGGSSIVHYNEKWVCEYNGREFNVEYTNNQYADDYQLEDIFNWCTEYLQKKVDPEIVGVEIFSDIIYHSSESLDYYEYTLPWTPKKVFDKKDAEKLLIIQRKYGSVHGLGIFYKVDNILDYAKDENEFLNENEKIIIGNEKYNKYYEQKKVVLSRNKLTKDEINIYLIDKTSFKRNSGALSGVSFLTTYTIGDIYYVDSFIKK